MLSLTNVYKSFENTKGRVDILKAINLQIKAGESISIVGPSGSGKTTLLGICASLDHVSSGKISLDGKDITAMSEDARAKLRNEKVGFVFQSFQLLPTLSALENVMVPMELKGLRNVEQRARELLVMVGLEHRIKHYPIQLSGGEQQRVAIARAFANEPKILFADEPTGNLDAETSIYIEKMLFDLNAEKNTSLVIVTHDLELAKKTQRSVRINNSELTEL